jgi:hypothetical protein
MGKSHNRQVKDFITNAERRPATDAEKERFRYMLAPVYWMLLRNYIFFGVILTIVTVVFAIHNYVSFGGQNTTLTVVCIITWLCAYFMGRNAIKHYWNLKSVNDLDVVAIEGKAEVIVPFRFDDFCAIRFISANGLEYPGLLDVEKGDVQDGSPVSLLVSPDCTGSDSNYYCITHIKDVDVE